MKKNALLIIGMTLATGATVALATIITSPSYQFLAVWVGGSGAAAASSSYQNTGSFGQPVAGAAAVSTNYKLHGGFIQQFPVSESGTSTASVDLGQAVTVTVNPPSGLIIASLPGGSFTEAVTVTAQIPVSFAAASSNIASLNGTQVGVDLINDKSLTAQKPVTITFHYRDSDIQGMEESRLRVAYYIPSEGRWVPVESTVDAANNTITTQHGVFGLLRVVEMLPASKAGAAFVYPNPFRPAKGHTQMHFTQLPEGAPLRLFTLAGELVRELPTDNAGEAVWDGRNGGGELVVSGVYLVHIRYGSETQTLKIAVER
jgi:hypothetical protein